MAQHKEVKPEDTRPRARPADFPKGTNIFLVPVREMRNKLPEAIAKVAEKRLPKNMGVMDAVHSDDAYNAVGRLVSSVAVMELKGERDPEKIGALRELAGRANGEGSQKSLEVLKVHNVCKVYDTEKDAQMTMILAKMNGKYFMIMDAYSEMVLNEEGAAVARTREVVGKICATQKNKEMARREKGRILQPLRAERESLLKQTAVFNRIATYLEYAVETSEIIEQAYRPKDAAHDKMVKLGTKELERYQNRQGKMAEWEEPTRRLIKEAAIMFGIAMGLISDLAHTVEEMEKKIAGSGQ